jgi:hypothetical protein
MKTRGDILLEAHTTINGERLDQYGLPENSFPHIAKLWSHWLEVEVGPADVAVMMVLLKLARQKNQAKWDNLVDACGYLALAADLEAGE